MELKFSIIIPAYNREKFIKRCIDSAISQTMSHVEYEIIVVDDNSTDSTYEILLGYAKKYPDLIRVYQLKKNSGGAATPRNKGIDEACGEYILFLDSDDSISNDILEKAYSFARDNNSDYIITKVAIKGKYLKNNVGKVNFMKDNVIAPLGGLGKIVRRSAINDMQVRFNPKYITGQDQIFNLQCLCTFETTSIMADKDYCFTYNDPDNLNHMTKIMHNLPYVFYIERAEHGITIILKSNKLTDEEKVRLCGQFIRKNLLYCGLGSFLKKLNKDSEVHQDNFNQLAKFINIKVPCEADNHCDPKLLPTLAALRKNDFEALENFTTHTTTAMIPKIEIPISIADENTVESTSIRFSPLGILGDNINIFVLCTGRCGSTTFVRAARHITNFTAGHETRVGFTGNLRFAYPPRHIEADNRLSWFLGRLDQAYGTNAYYIHLQRDIFQTAQSYRDRWGHGIMKGYRTAILFGKHKPKVFNNEDKLIYAIDYCETVTSNIKSFLKDKPNKMDFYLEHAEAYWKLFWDWIKAEGDYDKAVVEWKIKYNSR